MPRLTFLTKDVDTGEIYDGLPEGYAIVPIEPAANMIEEGLKCTNSSIQEDVIREIYKSMIVNTIIKNLN